MDGYRAVWADEEYILTVQEIRVSEKKKCQKEIDDFKKRSAKVLQSYSHDLHIIADTLENGELSHVLNMLDRYIKHTYKP